ncbi:hypothetical protein LTR10_023237 [Elasticomyces elasticus]|uniref:Uncharacterized protein n=1 Tax=Exophiala sideris TaxID=1016849 RepID=A0ABR0JLI9_9EURO|nr:hypothetical protein LTR10_023237 [Elasticomyces elasticus]KAK5035197.1 hypothetical protein LTS07_002633 [Exophiala sideris]KAK5039451.1 hypothetical protein LTR13_003708 [Exophiala sideris]KAK5066121.1 hypothetical protein LTR69_002639 [Exophiala sideris]KAK5186798.1 hypothetical protein LTR44_000804 [Eurotiomycetes sp. CCFEE 6388]
MSNGSTWSPSQDEASVRPSSQHVQLPSNFQPGTKVHTNVETIFHPAVTQEVVKQHTVKVVRDEISRDLHIHHFYTYVQPVKVVEVLPARHFVYDEETGEKVEIPTPAGWALPSDMTARTWNYDTHIRDLKPEYRHYVVDEERPNGELESPPPEYPPVNAGRKMKTATWSPFPGIAGQSYTRRADDSSRVDDTNRIDNTNRVDNASRVDNTSRANRF